MKISCKPYTTTVVMVGRNESTAFVVSFDNKYLKQVFKKNGIKFPDGGPYAKR